MHLIFFYKDDCAPCAARKPAAEQVAAETGVPIQFVNAGLDRATAVGDGVTLGEVLDRHQVRIVPTLVLIRDDGTRAATWAAGMILAATIIPAVRRQQGVTAP